MDEFPFNLNNVDDNNAFNDVNAVTRSATLKQLSDNTITWVGELLENKEFYVAVVHVSIIELDEVILTVFIVLDKETKDIKHIEELPLENAIDFDDPEVIKILKRLTMEEKTGGRFKGLADI